MWDQIFFLIPVPLKAWRSWKAPDSPLLLIPQTEGPHITCSQSNLIWDKAPYSVSFVGYDSLLLFLGWHKGCWRPQQAGLVQCHPVSCRRTELGSGERFCFKKHWKANSATEHRLLLSEKLTYFNLENVKIFWQYGKIPFFPQLNTFKKYLLAKGLCQLLQFLWGTAEAD